MQELAHENGFGVAGRKHMSDYKHTEGSAVERMNQWIHLCECSNATGEATEIMEEAVQEIERLTEAQERLQRALVIVKDLEIALGEST